MALRFIEKLQPEQIRHIPRVLYHWRVIEGSTAGGAEAKPYAVIAAEKAIQEHLDRRQIDATAAEDEGLPGAIRVRYQLPLQQPLVSIIIPTYNGYAILKQCIDSIIEKTSYVNYEILIVDNNTHDRETLRYLNDLPVMQPRIRVIRYPKPFNFAAINNMAVEQARGELVALLNNDIEVINANWLSEMVSHALRPEVGVVGARLWYPNDALQHGGVVLGIGGVAGHSHKGFPRGNNGYFSRAVLIQNFCAVTGACMILRKEHYHAVGGMNAEHLSVAFNDVDLCLKLHDRGLRNVWTPYAELYHHESISRGHEDTPEKIARFEKERFYMQQQWHQYLAADPCYSPNLSIVAEDFSYAWGPRVVALEELTTDESKKLTGVASSQLQDTLDNSNFSHRLGAYVLLHGQGLEIGNSAQRAAVPAHCQMQYLHVSDDVSKASINQSGSITTSNLQSLDHLLTEQFDFVIINHVLEYVSNPIAIIKELFRIIKTHGVVIISIVDKNDQQELTSFDFLWEQYQQSTMELIDLRHIKKAQSQIYHWNSKSSQEFLHETMSKLNIQVRCEYLSTGKENQAEHFSAWRKIK